MLLFLWGPITSLYRISICAPFPNQRPATAARGERRRDPAERRTVVPLVHRERNSCSYVQFQLARKGDQV